MFGCEKAQRDYNQNNIIKRKCRRSIKFDEITKFEILPGENQKRVNELQNM